MKRIATLALLGLVACTDPSVGIGLTFGTGGVSVSPSVSGRVGEATVTVSQ